MLTTSTVIAELIRDYVASATRGGRECRVVVPGLTQQIAAEVHALARESGIISYLAIGEGRKPDESLHWLEPVSLTNIRIGSFVAITDPGAMAEVRDSIRGTGGAIRSTGFSEEWPWKDDGPEAFRFRGPFSAGLVRRWSARSDEQAWLCSFLAHGLVPATSRLPDRASVLLDEIIGKFEPGDQAAGGVFERFLLHCGIPRPDSLTGDVRGLLRDTRSLVRGILERVRKEGDLRQQLLERVKETDTDAGALRSALQFFFDGLAFHTVLEGDLLAFRHCWGPPATRAKNWSILTAAKLRELFEVVEEQLVTLECSWVSGRGALVSADARAVACHLDAELQLKVRYAIPPAGFSPGACVLQASVRSTTLAEVPLAAAEGEQSLAIRFSDHELPHRTRVPVSVSIVIAGTASASARVHAHCCGPHRPAFAVGLPGFWVVNAEDISNDPAPALRQVVDEPTTLHFLCDKDVEPEVRVDEQENPLQMAKREDSDTWATAEPISALDAPGGQVTCTCRIGNRGLSVTLAAEDIIRGEFTLEDELRSMVAAARTEATKGILAIFEGKSSEPYSRLGGVNQQVQRKVRLARCFESRTGWQPMLADLLSPQEGTFVACGDFARSAGDCADTRGISAVTLPGAAVALVEAYKDNREAFRTAVLASLRTPSSFEEHPQYAAFPFYLSDGAQGRAALDHSLVGYLKSYCDIRAYLATATTTLEWEQVFVLNYLDCVVNWRADASRGSFFLIGPWHPLVVAKRFMVQRALVLRARRLVDGTSGPALAHLAGLLGDIPGFSWHASPRADDLSFEASYVVPTSDPGWHFAFKREATKLIQTDPPEPALVAATNAIRERLGLEARVRLPSTTAMVRSILNGYVRTFPSRRHMGIHFAGGFSGGEELREVDRFLHDDEKPTLAGEQLPGGINACFGEAPSVPDEIEWAGPSLKVFRYPEESRCVTEQHPNVVFSGSGNEVRFLDDVDVVALPRGAGYAAVFAQPLSRLVQGQTGISQSLTLEWDGAPSGEANDVGALFTRACGLNSVLAGGAQGIMRPANLPASLAAAWTVIPGAVLDPAVFVRYVRDGATRSLEHRALWDYRVSVGRTSTSYFVLSTIPAAFRNALNGKFPGSPNLAAECIGELGKLGLAIGGEAMRSGRHALGTLGVVAAVRLFHAANNQPGAFEWSEETAGFLIPVDSFIDLLERNGHPGDDPAGADRRRGDLIAMSLRMPTPGMPRMQITALVVECKFTNGTLDSAYATEALGQSKRSMERLAALCGAAAADDGMAERLALLQLVRFGLRISGGHEAGHAGRHRQEGVAYGCILRGEFELCSTDANSLLVSTEMSLPGSAEVTRREDGLWVRLNRQHWPGVSETPAVGAARTAICGLFSRRDPRAQINPAPVAPVIPTPPVETQLKAAESNQAPYSPPPPAMPAQPENPVPPVPPQQQANRGAMLQKILVGVDSSRRSVYFDPHSPVDRLDNVNTMVTGSSGKGKTQLVKYLVTRIREQGANATLIDFKNDFVSDSHFVKTARLDATLVTFDGMPFNPLIPFPIADPRTGKKFIQCAQHITGIAAVFRRTYSLGAQQEAAVKNAIRAAFSNAGVDPAGIVPFDPEKTFPDLAAVGEILAETNPTAYNRLDPLFTLGLFREQFWRTSFDSMVDRSVALDFSQLPSDELKNALAELVILSAHSYFNSQPHSGPLKQLFVVDEAHRILKADFLERFALECRAYGVGLLLSSQYPSQFTQDISSSMATKVIHGNGRDVDRVREIVNLLGCAGQESAIADLNMFEAIFSNKHFSNMPIRTMTYPLHLAYQAVVASGSLTLEEIARIPGIDPQKLPPANLVYQLERLGLCETIGSRVQPVKREA